MEKLTCGAGEPIEQCNPGVVASDIESLKEARDGQWERLEELRRRQEEDRRRLERLESLLKGAGGNGHPSWSERLILLEDWQQRQEQLLSALPTHLAEIKTHLQALLSQRSLQAEARSHALWTAIASLTVAVLVGAGSAAFVWWRSHS